MKRRPYLEKSTAELEEIFLAAAKDAKTLRAIGRELSFRRTQVARALATKVARTIDALLDQPEPRHEPASPPTSILVICNVCSQKLRLDLQKSPGRFTCPSCKAPFTARRLDGVVSLTYIDSMANKAQAEEPTSVDDAYHVLAVDPACSWQDIERARRKRLQEYHPDKVEQLGPKLRAVAAQEAKNINVAFEILRRARSI